jgi:hypothetical protein
MEIPFKKDQEEIKKEEQEYKYPREVAEGELKKMLNFYEIKIEEIEDKDLKKVIQAGYGRLIKAVRLGRLEIKIEDGTIKVIQTTRNGTKITYDEINGLAKMAMAGHDEKDYYGKSYALMGSLSNLGESAILKMKGVDLSLAEVLGMIFLSV